LPALGAVLGSASKHFDQVIVQAIIKLALKAPLELGVVQIARMKFKVVIVNRNRRVLELNDDFYALALLPGTEGEQWVFVETELL